MLRPPLLAKRNGAKVIHINWDNTTEPMTHKQASEILGAAPKDISPDDLADWIVAAHGKRALDEMRRLIQEMITSGIIKT